ncbi:hypothetical protein SLEP1_g31810 [Rubroshorea leprosula]|uniref:Uncharacterized protein n=1 Tax=Rubroshorea leprosula TaxID=152421 RepID=A0AAV5KBB2_9ROSI|nr:hypothetical protein SLEP1_g31810 [Rubroshorea leprosula]
MLIMQWTCAVALFFLSPQTLVLYLLGIFSVYDKTRFYEFFTSIHALLICYSLTVVLNILYLHCPELSEEESKYEFDYEVLSGVSAQPWDDTEQCLSASGTNPFPDARPSVTQNNHVRESKQEDVTSCNKEKPQYPVLMSKLVDKVSEGVVPNARGPGKASKSDELVPNDFDDLEQLMSGIKTFVPT